MNSPELVENLELRLNEFMALLQRACADKEDSLNKVNDLFSKHPKFLFEEMAIGYAVQQFAGKEKIFQIRLDELERDEALEELMDYFDRHRVDLAKTIFKEITPFGIAYLMQQLKVDDLKVEVPDNAEDLFLLNRELFLMLTSEFYLDGESTLQTLELLYKAMYANTFASKKLKAEECDYICNKSGRNTAFALAAIRLNSKSHPVGVIFGAADNQEGLIDYYEKAEGSIDTRDQEVALNSPRPSNANLLVSNRLIPIQALKGVFSVRDRLQDGVILTAIARQDDFSAEDLKVMVNWQNSLQRAANPDASFRDFCRDPERMQKWLNQSFYYHLGRQKNLTEEMVRRYQSMIDFAFGVLHADNPDSDRIIKVTTAQRPYSQFEKYVEMADLPEIVMITIRNLRIILKEALDGDEEAYRVLLDSPRVSEILKRKLRDALNLGS